MDRSIPQALNSLVPSLIGPLPPELTELAGSLLAQSRGKANSLKADEEIARTYACANIACERLKQTLDLPKIEPRPPCPPRIYQKLYRYLDGALPTATPKRTRHTKNNDIAESQKRNRTVNRTPLHERPSAPKRTTPRRAAKTEKEPQWIVPVTRQLCRGLAAPAAPHHVLAGMSSICSSIESSRETATSSIDVKLPALLIAVFHFVYTRLGGVETPTEEYSRRTRLALSIVKDSLGGDADNMDFDENDVNECMRKFGEQRWNDMDWFENVPTGNGLGDADISNQHIDDVQPETDVADDLLLVNKRGQGRLDVSEKGYLQPGLGTMMQDKVDYLSDERRRDFRQWKSDILSQIQDMEKQDNLEQTGAG